MEPTVTFIGAGGVAWSLAQALSRFLKTGQVYSRDIANARRLTDIVGGEPVDTPEQITPGRQLYIVALADHAAADVIARLTPSPQSVWALTSGTLPMQMLAGLSDNFGVFYPLQTFSRGLTVDYSDVPVFVEGSTPFAKDFLLQLAGKITSRASEADASRRKKLHIAGVLTCNFVNHLWDTADALLQKEGLGIDVVRPLIEQSLAKIATITPHDAQTGPARRADLAVMRSHIDALPDDDLRQLYHYMSNRILKSYYPENESYRL